MNFQNPFSTRVITSISTLASVVLLSGCATYIPPSGRADLSSISSISSSTMKESFQARPTAVFPASIAAVRVQTSGYRSYYTEREGGVYGNGRYSVITVKEVEDDSDFQRLSKLPDIGGFISISRLLLPPTLQSDRDVREAAARLKADMVLLYTFDTSFHDNDDSLTLSVVTLGISPTRHVYVRVAATALLMDTRTGFIYAALEANENREVRTNAWESRETADRARQDAEKAAFKGLVGEFEKNWAAVVERAKKGA
jgi:hypothetical protein